jgi:hypothetical protein
VSLTHTYEEKKINLLVGHLISTPMALAKELVKGLGLIRGECILLQIVIKEKISKF